MIGDTNDNVQRQKSVLPPWFPDLANAPILTSLLTGAGDAFSFIKSTLDFAALQTRIATSTSGWLDMIAWDFFGGNFVRRQGEADGSFEPRIQAEILRPRQTRLAISIMLTQLTGVAPIIQEAWNTFDFGSYGTGTMGYGAGLGYGSLQFNNQIFIQAYRSNNNGVPLVSGYGTVGGGYGVGSFAYVDTSEIVGLITDAEIYERVQQTIAAGTIAWVDIQDGPATNPVHPSMIFSNVYDATYVALL